ncbi:recombinase family protein, partial [Patescibacteria group bacterium]|nr:recombinase family protein [Patescibacteria group bacterium]
SSLNLNIVKTYSESKSAKSPNLRPKFNAMVEEITQGKVNGILCWQINRLSRNPQESGLIQQLLQDKKLFSIQTIDKEYRPEDNALLLSVENGVSNQFIIDLRKSTIRGLKSKLEAGIPPFLAPIGYMNDTESKTVVLDPERKDIVREMWELMLTGSYTPSQILEIATNEWGLRTKQYKRRGNKKLSYSGVYRMFTSIFYTGSFIYDGEIYKGSYPALVTKDEFDTVQCILSKKQKPRPSKHKFAFTGLIKCSECGCHHTAEEKYKIIKSTGKKKRYVYYHCTRKKRDIKCSQKKHVREEKIYSQIENEIKKYKIHPAFRNWAFKIIDREKNNLEITENREVVLHKTLNNLNNQLTNLTKMRYKEMISDQEYISERKSLRKDIEELESQIEKESNRMKNTEKVTKEVFNFATFALDKFQNGSLETKKEVATDLGYNYFMEDGKLSIDAHKWFIPIEKGYKKLEDRYSELEPAISLNNNNNEGLQEVYSLWGDLRESNP